MGDGAREDCRDPGRDPARDDAGDILTRNCFRALGDLVGVLIPDCWNDGGGYEGGGGGVADRMIGEADRWELNVRDTRCCEGELSLSGLLAPKDDCGLGLCTAGPELVDAFPEGISNRLRSTSSPSLLELIVVVQAALLH